jgi:hypothetical protein
MLVRTSCFVPDFQKRGEMPQRNKGAREDGMGSRESDRWVEGRCRFPPRPSAGFVANLLYYVSGDWLVWFPLCFQTRDGGKVTGGVFYPSLICTVGDTIVGRPVA